MTTATIKDAGTAPEKKERTPVDVVLERPVKVTFGGKVYEVKPAKIDHNMKWLEKCGEFAGDFFGEIAQHSDPSGNVNRRELMRSLMPALATRGIGSLWDLVFIYAPDLPRKEIEGTASFDEKLDAIEEVFALALPFIVRLAKMMNLLEAAF